MILCGSRLGAMLRVAAVALLLVAAGGCTSGAGDHGGSGAGTAAVPAVQDAATLVGSRWRAEEIDGRATDDAVPSTLEFDAASRVSGSSGCNRFMGPVEVGAGNIRFGALAATRMACPPPGMEQESRFFAALAQAKHWRIGADGRLVLADAADRPLVVLGRQPA